MPASIVAAFGSLVIELSKKGAIVMLAFADKQEAAKNDKAASGRKEILSRIEARFKKRRNRRSVFMAGQ